MNRADIQAVIRQQEIPHAIKQGAINIAKHVGPFESLMDATTDEPTEQIAITAILREEGVLSPDFMRAIESYSATVGSWMTGFWRQGQSPSKSKSQVHRAMNILFDWANQFQAHGRAIAATLLRDAFWRADTSALENMMPHPILRPRAAGLNINGKPTDPGMDRLMSQIAWINFRDNMAMNNWQTATNSVPKEYAGYLDDVLGLLDESLCLTAKAPHGWLRVNLRDSVRRAANISEVVLMIPEPNAFTIATFSMRTATNEYVHFGLSRFNAELIPDFLAFISVRGLYQGLNEEAYQTFRLSAVAVLYDCLTNGLLEIRPWVSSSLADEEVEEPITVGGPAVQPPDEPPMEPAEAQPSVELTAPPVTVTTKETVITKDKPSFVARGRLTWRRVIRTLKSFEVRVEWTDHPMLCRDGKRVRYPNPHDTDVKTNARYLHQALKAFGISREEFYARL